MTSSLIAMMPGFSEEMLKEAGFKDLVVKMPHLVKTIPAKSKKVVDQANLQAARLGTKYPGIYRELHDPTNYPGPVSFLKKLLGQL